MTKFTDYGIVLMAHMAAFPEDTVHNVRDISNMAGVPLPMAQKIYKELSKKGLLTSQRGSTGGYLLARPADEITVLEMMEILEGPVSLTECSSSEGSSCSIEIKCPVCDIWSEVNTTLRGALSGITLKKMAEPLALKLKDRMEVAK